MLAATIPVTEKSREGVASCLPSKSAECAGGSDCFNCLLSSQVSFLHVQLMSCVVYDCCLLALEILQFVESEGKWSLVVVVDFLYGVAWY